MAVLEATTAGGGVNVGLSEREFGLELCRAIRMTTVSSPKKNKIRSLFTPFYFFDNFQSQMLNAPATTMATPLVHIGIV